MSRRTSRPSRSPQPHAQQSRSPRRETRRAPVAADAPCPCGLPAAYGACCGRFHSGQAAAPTAEALMRARFSAFAVEDEAYLLRSWHPDTRPPRVEFDAGQRWQRLEVLDATGGSAFHTTGTVTFRAHYSYRSEPGELREHSRFERYEGAWVYVDGVVEE
ncbi:YchJ family metal-binding protein [Streptomyces sp. NBC_01387]|uniref:YchJ family protein n=1 Tax=unclassified Streptomyces TaxID=2593676 RepID=UPI00225B0090|nr:MULTISPECIES: YchJ family metal-binding protein [unclassified Streptomyces]MCX4553847.1 YchJ family metal-binding protein [Streptomyces sp. NBC_01500]